MFDELHREQYNSIGFLPKALNIFKTQKYNNGQLSNLVGSELAVLLKQKLIEEGYTDIRFEVDVGETKVDVLATKQGQQYAFECKASKELPGKVIKQIKAYKGRYKNVSVFCCSDTHIDYKILRAIKEEKANVVRADISKEELTKRVLKLFEGC